MRRVCAIAASSWPSVFPHVLPFIVEAIQYAHGEWSVADFDQRVLRGELLAFVITDDEKPVALIAGSFIYYPQRTVFHCTFVAGKMTNYVAEFQQVMHLIKRAGAMSIETCCRPSVSRLLKRTLGFGYKCDTLRLDL